ncbi:Trm112 family protein [Paracoccaceae bacterium]|jgi:hypothetical protein|nr:Trm112 family protein [Paracoccaceae bacterium]
MTQSENGFDRKMLEALICPQTHSTLKFNQESQELVSSKAGVAYPIRDGIPVMLIDEARQMSDEEFLSH